MAGAARSTRKPAKTAGGKPKSKPVKISTKRDQAPSTKPSSIKGPGVEALKKTIAYYYLLSYCPPACINEWVLHAAPMRQALADSAGMDEAAYFELVTPEACRRIVSFHQATREPAKDWIDRLLDSASEAAKGPKEALAFQKQMSEVARLPQRAASEGRLHRKKGCQFCQAPCSYGYFTLVSDPPFIWLQDLFAQEARKPAAEQNPLNPLMRFTIQHLKSVAGVDEEFIEPRHLVNLSYCLLMLGMAKSRMPVPERQLQTLQAAGQAYLRARAS